MIKVTRILRPVILGVQNRGWKDNLLSQAPLDLKSYLWSCTMTVHKIKKTRRFVGSQFVKLSDELIMI